jgi:BRCA1-associated protein
MASGFGCRLPHQAETSEAKVQELEEQVRDLMFFLEAQKTIEAEGGADGPSELAGGNVEVVAKPTRARGKKKKK